MSETLGVIQHSFKNVFFVRLTFLKDPSFIKYSQKYSHIFAAKFSSFLQRTESLFWMIIA